MTDLRLASATPASRPIRSAALGFALTVTGATTVLAALPFKGVLAPATGFLALVATGGVVIDRLATFHPHPRFGHGNAITLVRAAGAAVFLALALEPHLLAGNAGWAGFALALALLALDGLDGLLARRQRLVSAFGARFDMEVDALLILALSALTLGLGKAGPWVLALGLFRYAFVLAGCLHPALAAPLPPSPRRRAVCAIVIAVVALLLAPPLAPPASAFIAATALAALAASFAADLAWLVRHRA